MSKALKIGVCAICLMLTYYSQAQNQSSNDDRSINLMTGYSNLFNGILITPAYGIEREKSHFYFGPTLFLAIGDNPSTSKNFTLTGLQGSYQRFPVKGDTRVNLYFQGDLIAQRRREEGSSTIFNAQTSSFDSFKFKKNNSHLQFYAGYGLRWELSKNLFISQGIGIGPAVTFERTTSDFGRVSNTFIDVDWMLKIGLVKVL